jgi:hypothetical protein
MKKVALLSFIFLTAFIPQVLFAGGGPAVKTQPLTAEQITSTTAENPLESTQGSTESASDAQVSANSDDTSSVLTFFSEASENGAILNGMNALVLFGVAVLVIGIAFFAYTYYRKTQEINQMLGIQADGSDLDETTKTE